LKFWQLYKKELIAFVVCFGLGLSLSILLSLQLNHKYKESFLENNAFIINEILEHHPELEYEIMSFFKNPNPNYSLDKLKQYGFLDHEVLSYLTFVRDLEQYTKQLVRLAFFVTFGLFFIIVLIFYIEKYRRIHNINDYLFRVLQNDYKVDLKDYREDSISILKSDLSKVTNKLRSISESSLASKKDLERLMSDISHQLRTPLTSLSIINEALSSNTISKQQERLFLQQQKEQLARMEWLIVTLLKMSQIDSGTILFQLQETSVYQMIEDAFKPSLIPLELKNIKTEIKMDSKLTCMLDYHWTLEAFVNLIKNAMEHTKENGSIVISANDNPMFVEIIVEDNGTGIAKKDLPHIFERFYKGNTKSESIGIGLNLSKTIIERQNGTIRVESVEGKGTKFIIHFFKVTV